MAHTSRESDRCVKTLPKSAISVDALMYGILPIPLSFITYVARVNHCVGLRMRAVRCCALQIQSTTCRTLSAARCPLHVVRCTADKLRFTLVEPSLAMHSSEPT